jgi:hypothetical protein
MPNIPTNLLTSFAPSPNALLDLIRKQTDNSMLREIAEADYGMDADAHLLELYRIRDTGQISAPIKWEPKEVLELIRWSEPDAPNTKQENTGTRGHIMRAFACAALLRAAADPANTGYFDSENSTIAQLLASALVLGRDLQEAAASFLAWRIEQLNVDQERPFFALALLILATLLGQPKFSEEELGHLADWTIAEEAFERQEAYFLPEDGEQWLLGLTYYNLRHNIWQSLAHQLVAEAAKLRSDKIRSQLEDIGSRILRKN